ncbi:MAG TPA: hypothetical protein VJ550_06830 [Geomonas sp.]|nr:hypothetical protein [Geomonas sp.]
MTRGSLIKKLGSLLLETVGSLLLVLVLFSLFMVSLHAMFPEGTPLRELVGESPEPGAGRYAGGRQVEATLTSLQRDVRFRRWNSVAWGGASEGMPLFSQDAVQTLDNSGATLSFTPKDRLLLGSNSLLVVTRLNSDSEGGTRNYRVQVDGEVRGSLSGRSMRMELSAAGHLARISSGTARFRVTPNGSDSAGFAVYQGEAQFVGSGRTVRVSANYGVMLRKGVAVGRPVPLPPAPAVDAEKAVYHYRLLPPRVAFPWKAPSGDFHFQLSRDPHFRTCLIDEKVTGYGGGSAGDASAGGGDGGAGAAAVAANPRAGSLIQQYVTGKLAKGSYYWRVSRIEEGREGAFSRVGQCQLVQVLDSPELSVNFPPEQSPPGPFLLNGAVPPGSRVFVDGVEVACTSGGQFNHQVFVSAGVNLIRVEALDHAGNASYASRIVYGVSGPGDSTR